MCPAIMVQKLVGEIREKNSVLDNSKMKNKEFNNIMSFFYIWEEQMKRTFQMMDQ